MSKELEIYETDSMEDFNIKNESFLSILQSAGLCTEKDTIYALPITNWENNKIGIPINKIPNSRPLLISSLTIEENDLGYYARPKEK
jgi:hypothetical protein